MFYQLGHDRKPATLADDVAFKHASNDIPDGEIRPQSPSGRSEIKSLIDGRQDEKKGFSSQKSRWLSDAGGGVGAAFEQKAIQAISGIS